MDRDIAGGAQDIEQVRRINQDAIPIVVKSEASQRVARVAVADGVYCPQLHGGEDVKISKRSERCDSLTPAHLGASCAQRSARGDLSATT